MRKFKAILILVSFFLMTMHNFVPHHHHTGGDISHDEEHVSVLDHHIDANELFALLFQNHTHTSHNQTEQYEFVSFDLKRVDNSKQIVFACLNEIAGITENEESKDQYTDRFTPGANQVFSYSPTPLRAPPICLG